MPPKTHASNHHATGTAAPTQPQVSAFESSPPTLEYAELPVESITSTSNTVSTDTDGAMDTDETIALLPSAKINDYTGPDSPAWEIEANSYLSQCMVDGAYPKLLSALETWKQDGAIASRVAAFMEYGPDMKTFPANFGKHLMYCKTCDTPLHIVFFGEVADPSFGTALGARGNHYVGMAGNVRQYF